MGAGGRMSAEAMRMKTIRRPRRSRPQSKGRAKGSKGGGRSGKASKGLGGGANAADARRRLRDSLAILARRASGPRQGSEHALPALVLRALKRLELARQKAKTAASSAEDEAYDALAVLVRELRLSMRDAGKVIGFPFIEVEPEADGRWIAEIPALPGVAAYGKTRDAALANVEALAMRVVAEDIERGLRSPPGAFFVFDRGLFKRIEREKQASRDADARDLASGRKTPEQLRQENEVFSGLRVWVDYKNVKDPR